MTWVQMTESSIARQRSHQESTGRVQTDELQQCLEEIENKDE